MAEPSTNRAAIAAFAREGGRASGRARKRLTLAVVESELPAMDSPENVRAGLQLLQRWIAAGLLNGSQGMAAVRAAEAWLRLHEHELDRHHMKRLEQRLRELEAELAARPLRRVMP